MLLRLNSAERRIFCDIPCSASRHIYLLRCSHTDHFQQPTFPLQRHSRKPQSIMGTETTTTRKCLGADCENDASSLQCPTCQKMGKESFFCSQDCFKKNWVLRKNLAPPWPDPLTKSCRVSTRHYTKPPAQPQVTLSVISSRRKSSHSPTQKPATTTPSLPSPSPVTSVLSTLCRPAARCPRAYRIPTMRRMVFQGVSKSSSIGIRSRCSTRRRSRV